MKIEGCHTDGKHDWLAIDFSGMIEPIFLDGPAALDFALHVVRAVVRMGSTADDPDETWSNPEAKRLAADALKYLQSMDALLPPLDLDLRGYYSQHQPALGKKAVA